MSGATAGVADRPAPDLPRPASAPPPGGSAISARGATSAVRWSAVAIGGRQVFQLGFGVLLARLLGPADYGLVGVATLFVTVTTLLLDQGLSAALVQRKDLSPRVPGASATLNLASGLVLTALTWLAAPAIAGFFHRAALVGVLRLLACGLVLKAVMVTPRAMLLRRLAFRPLAVADLAGAAAGAAAGTVAVLLGAGVHAVVAQVVGTDAVVLTLLLTASRGPWPNRHLRELAPLMAFGIRIFATNSLAIFSRNTDNVLVGRYLGSTALGLYGMAYRVLVIPVQLLGQTVTRVLFPVFSRIADDRERLARTLLAATELLAMAAVPPMALVACSAPQFVVLGLGPQWRPAAPLIAVLALAGAREAIFYITPALMTATGRADLNLRYEVGATAAQVGGMLVGLRWGVQGVATGYAVVGFLLTPVLLRLQVRLAGVSGRRQLAAIWPAVHAAAWASSAYLLLAATTGWSDARTLVVGSAAYVVVALAVLRVAHPTVTQRTVARVLSRGPAPRRRRGRHRRTRSAW